MGADPAAPLVVGLAACAYIAAVDPNHSSAYPQCPTKMLTGLDCPMCGATRAVHSLLHGDVVGAMDHNLLFVLLLPALAYAFVAWTATRMGHPLKPIPIVVTVAERAPRRGDGRLHHRAQPARCPLPLVRDSGGRTPGGRCHVPVRDWLRRVESSRRSSSR